MLSDLAESGPRASLVDGDYRLTHRDFTRIASMLKADSGIALAENRTALVYSRLAKRLRALGMQSFNEYCDLVESKAGQEERQAMLYALTTNLTKFFREPHHFSDFETNVVQRLMSAARRGGQVRFWSAACSTGQEAYSMGMSLLSRFPDAGDYDVKILATDIDREVVKRAKAAGWSSDEITQIPPLMAKKFLTQSEEDGLWYPTNSLRSVIVFKELNLVGDWPIRVHFDAIFCRNVTIYFDEATQRSVWDRLCDRLKPDGTLYIGHSERLSGDRTSFMQSCGVTTFRARAGASA